MNPILPPVDPSALPAPVWLFRLLLLVTFFLHVVAMNFLLGGGFLAAISGARGRSNVPHHRHLAERISKILPVVMAATISLGVAPLLFIQVLYGRFFYTASILMAVPWLSVIFLLVIAYYGHYYMAMSDTLRRERRLWVAWRLRAPGGGDRFHLHEQHHPDDGARAVPRSLCGGPDGSAAQHRRADVDSALPAHAGRRDRGERPWREPVGQRSLSGKDPAFGKWAVRYGRNWFAGGTLVQILVGVWFLFTLPPATRSAFLGGNPVYTAHLFGAAFLALLAVFLIVAKPDSRKVLLGSAGLLTLTLVGMILVRMWVRDLQIGRLADLEHAAVGTQWSVLPLFLALFVATLATLAWMIRAYVVERAETGSRRRRNRSGRTCGRPLPRSRRATPDRRPVVFFRRTRFRT